jgi:hypothetical protein
MLARSHVTEGRDAALVGRVEVEGRLARGKVLHGVDHPDHVPRQSRLLGLLRRVDFGVLGLQLEVLSRRLGTLHLCEVSASF